MAKHTGQRFSKRDANHPDVVRWYEELHCSVLDLYTLGNGCSDLLIGCGMVSNELVEVKSESGEESANQLRFRREWRGKAPRIVRTHGDVIAHVHEMRQRLRRELY